MKNNFFTVCISLALLSFVSCSTSEENENLEVSPEDINALVDKSFDPNLDELLVDFVPKIPIGTSEPLFKFSITSNDIDFILETDPDVFESLTYEGRANKEMPDKRSDILRDENSYVFTASFENGKKVGIWCHSSFSSKEEAEAYANKLCPRLGKLPSHQRDMLSHVIIHTGDEVAFGETAGRFFVLYADNMDKRISTNDLEETVFHESVHATIQDLLESTPKWKETQGNDNGNYVTNYAKSLPAVEDMPETAIFCYTAIKYPGRLPENIEQWVKDYIPNRLAFFEGIYK